VFVDQLRGARRFHPGEHRLFYSMITRAELFAGSGSEEAPVRALLRPLRELPVDRATAERGGRLRRERRMSIADALIAATALERGLTLVTRNRRDFEGVSGLGVLDPDSFAAEQPRS
jgi:predicted nucleic acid-binding protein